MKSLKWTTTSSLLLSACALFAFAPHTLAKDFIGAGVTITPDNDFDVRSEAVEIFIKKEVVELSDSVSLNLNGFVNNATETGVALSLDASLGNRVDVGAGLGIAKRLDGDRLGTLTGYDEDVIPYAQVDASFDLTRKTGLYLKGMAPFNSQEGKEFTTTLGVFLKF